MDGQYRPVSPDLSSYRPVSPDLSGALPSTHHGHHHSNSRDRFGNLFLENPQFDSPQNYPTSAPNQHSYDYDSQLRPYDMPPTTRRMKAEVGVKDEYLPDAEEQQLKQEQSISVKQELQPLSSMPVSNGTIKSEQNGQQQQPRVIPKTEPGDPTLGVQLKTSFPVARIKRIMQADDDIGKVAQVTPHVVSRALELFMIKIISASAAQAVQGGGGGGKGPKRILAQHVKKALQADVSYDFLEDIIKKVPDAPTKATKKEQPAGSDSEDGMVAAKPVKKRARKRKDTGDD